LWVVRWYVLASFVRCKAFIPRRGGGGRLWFTHARKEWAVVALKGGGRTFFWSL